MNFNHAASGLVLLALTSLTNAASAETNLRLMHFFPETLMVSQTDAAFAEDVATRTNGEVTIEIFWAGALGRPTEVIELVGSGAVEMGATLPNYTPAQLPFSSLGAVPLGYFSDAAQALATERAVLADPATQAELERVNLVPLLVHGLAPYHLICTQPVSRVADLDGIRVRTFGAYAPAALQEFGMVPVNLQPAEIYEALQRGNVDCVMYNYDFAASSRLHEVAKHWSTINLGSFSGYQIYINADVLAALPEDHANAIVEAARTAEEGELPRVVEAEQAAIATATEAGVTFVEFEEQEAFDARLPDTLDVWAAQTVEAGVDQADVDRIVTLVREMAGQ